MYQLVFLSGPARGRRVAVRKPVAYVGRDPESDIRLEDEGVSWRHAVLEEDARGVRIRDAGALNKVLVNGREVRETLLRHGDEIELGLTRLRFEQREPGPPLSERRISHVQGVTYALVALVVLLEIVVVAGLALWGAPRVAWTREGEGGERQGKPAPAERAPREPEGEAEIKPVAAQSLAEGAPAAVEGGGEPQPGAPAAEAGTSGPPPEEAMGEPAGALREAQAAAEAARPPEQEEALPEAPAVEEEVGGAPADPLRDWAREIVEQARLEIRRHNFAQADEQLARAQLVAPDYLPAYAERARLFERRGLLDEAAAQWNELLRRGAGTPWQEYAFRERQRLAQEQLRRTSALAAPAEPVERRLPRKLKVESAEEQRPPVTGEFEEMRVVTVVLRSVGGPPLIKRGEVAVHVAFFDRDADTGQVVPSEAVVPTGVLWVEGDWPRGERRSLSAACLAPRGFRQAQRERTGKRYTPDGFVVRLYYQGQLQDIFARPEELVERARELPEPSLTPPRPATAEPRT